MDDDEWEDEPRKDERSIPKRIWEGLGGMVAIVFVIAYGMQVTGVDLDRVRTVYEGITGSGTDCDGVEEWIERSRVWERDAERILQRGDALGSDTQAVLVFESQMLGLRDTVLDSRPPEAAAALNADMASFFEVMADVTRASFEGDYVARERLLSEGERVANRVEALGAELDEACG